MYILDTAHRKIHEQTLILNTRYEECLTEEQILTVARSSFELYQRMIRCGYIETLH
jgi:hypothetical protein